MLHINRFIDKLKAANDRNQRDYTMSIAEARDLHGDITKLLIALQDYHEKSTASVPTVSTIEVDGGSF